MFKQMVVRRSASTHISKAKGFSFPEIAVGMLVIAVVATSTAPQFYRLLNHFRDQAAAASARTVVPALIVHWDERGNFLAFDPQTAVGPGGGPIMAGDSSIGAHLPEIDKVVWSITDVSANSISIEWDIKDCQDCRAGLELEIKTSEDGMTNYPVWDYYHYEYE